MQLTIQIISYCRLNARADRIFRGALDIDPILVQRLKELNQYLWEIEDNIRDQERQKNFGETFIRMARSVYQQNDRRAAMKKKSTPPMAQNSQKKNTIRNIDPQHKPTLAHQAAFRCTGAGGGNRGKHGLLGIRLCLHNHAPQQLALGSAIHNQASDEVGSHLCWAAEEGWREVLGDRDGYGSGLAGMGHS